MSSKSRGKTATSARGKKEEVIEIGSSSDSDVKPLPSMKSTTTTTASTSKKRPSTSSRAKPDPDAEESSSEEEDRRPSKAKKTNAGKKVTTATTGSGSGSKIKNGSGTGRGKAKKEEEDYEMDDGEEDDDYKGVAVISSSSEDDNDDDDDEADFAPRKSASTSKTRSKPAAKPNPKPKSTPTKSTSKLKAKPTPSSAKKSNGGGDDDGPAMVKKMSGEEVKKMGLKVDLNSFDFPKARLLLRQDLEDEYDPLDVPAKHKKSSMFKDMGVLFTGVSEVEGGRMKLEDYVESYAGAVHKAPADSTAFCVAGKDLAESKRKILKSKGIDCISEEDFLLVLRYWGKNKEMYGGGEKEKEKEKKARGVTKEEREAAIARAFDFDDAKSRREKDGHAPLDPPMGQPNCLRGLTFVFTGELQGLDRPGSQELAKRYGAKVTTSPSGNTTFVVIGENAGPAKLKKIEELGVRGISEAEFYDLIRYRPAGGKLDEKQQKAEDKQQKNIMDEAKRLEKEEREAEKDRARKGKIAAREGMPVKKDVPLSSQLWTTKYAPKDQKELCGNKGNADKLAEWLKLWPKSYSSGFKKPGKDGMGIFRAVLISGPPGIGKTTAAHMMAKACGYHPLELNASDARSKKLLQNATNVDNASLDGWFSGGSVKDTTVAGMAIGRRTCLIMDEVDGMSGGDRGGVGAMNILIKAAKIPLILICNDPTLQKMKPLLNTTFPMKFRRPTPQEIRARVMSIAFKEKLKLDSTVVDSLVEASQSDMRQILNMLSTWRLNKQSMSFDESKKLGKENQKYTIMTPFNIVPKLIGPYAFSATNRETLNDKMDYYFQDFSFVPLFLQENYIKNAPARLGAGAKDSDDPESQMKRLDFFSKAADSISEGDLIDRMIHGQEQHWSLLPAHGMASTVRPAWYIYGQSSQGGYNPVAFPQWLGQNSKRQKLGRLLGDIQIKMRLRVSGSREEVRQQYMPLLAQKLVTPLFTGSRGSENAAVEEIIPCLDSYYLNKEDWDAFVELGVDDMADGKVLPKIATSIKSAFTRVYNKTDHPIAYHRGTDLFAGKKVTVAKEAPDFEETFPDDDVADDGEADNVDGDDEDTKPTDAALMAKDKLIKSKAAKKPAAAKSKKKA